MKQGGGGGGGEGGGGEGSLACLWLTRLRLLDCIIAG